MRHTGRKGGLERLFFAAGQWRHSVDIFEQMEHMGCEPDAGTYGALLTAFDKGNQWTRALQVSPVTFTWERLLPQSPPFMVQVRLP